MNSFPFTSQDGDRKVKTSDFRELFKKYFTNGVFNGTFNVVQSTGMKVILKKGWCNIEGCFGWTDEDIELNIDYVSQETTHNIVLRLDDNREVRKINAYVVEGNPNAVEPTRTQTVYELVVARIKTNSTTTSITQRMIEDTRLNTSLCGLVASSVQVLDTNTYYDQLQGALDEFLDTVQQAIDGTLAGNLQSQITQIDELSKELQSNINAIEDGSKILSKYIYLDGATVPTNKNWDELEVNKIYLTSGTYKTSNNAPINGNLGGVLIYVSVTNGAVQLYLPRIETGKIYLRGKYSNAWREWICSADGGDASTIDGVNISDIVQKSKSGLLQVPDTVDNGLTIGLTGGVGNGKIELINNYSEVGKATNIPISQMIAVKQTFVASSAMGLVRLYELWPVRGRVWQNEYNGGSSPRWDGWKLVQGEYQLWSGSSTEGNSIGQSGNYVDLDMFKNLKVVANNTTMILPIGSDNVAWGSAITVGGSKEIYLCSVKLTLNKSLNQFSVNVCSQITYPNNSPTTMTLTKIIGLP